MRKFACLMGLLLLASVSASAQDTSKISLFGGYSFLHYNPGGSTTDNFNGGVGSVAFELNNWIGGVAEFSGYHNGSLPQAPQVDVNTVNYLFGPKIFKHMGKLTPFGQLLAGGTHASASAPTGGIPTTLTSNSNAFALSLGGGLDWAVSPHFAIRLGQVDYLMTRYSFNAAKVFNFAVPGVQSENNFRYSAGLVLTF